MMPSGLLADRIESYKDDPEFIAESIALEFLEQAVARMKEQQITQAALARALGITRPAVSQMLGSGAHNMTVQTMVRLSRAVGGDLEIKIATKSARPLEAVNFVLEVTKDMVPVAANAEAQEFAAAA